MKAKFTLCRWLSFALLAALMLTQFSCKQTPEKEEGPEGKENLQFSLKKRFEQQFKLRVDPALGRVPSERLIAASEQIKKYFMNQPKTAVSGISWVERGPTNVGGRVHGMVWDANDPTGKTVFAGGVSGGLWKNTDITANTAWTKVTDVLDAVSITSIVQLASNPQIMYMSTGDEFDVSGVGIFKSTDGGNTWFHLSSTAYAKYDEIQKLILKSDGTLFAATHNDVVKSTDGGLTFTSILSKHVWSMSLSKDGDLYVGGYDGKVLKTIDNGANWTTLTIPTDATNGDANTTVACAPSDNTVVYVIKSDATNYDCNYVGYSSNSGGSFTSKTIPKIYDQAATATTTFTRGQGFYDLVCTVDPLVPARLWVGGIDALRSENNGGTWVQETAWSTFGGGSFTAAQNVHADHHNLVFKPGSSSEIVLGTDGGIFYCSTANTAGSAKLTFSMRNNGLHITQFYWAGGSGTSGSNVYIAGAQDNGTTRFTAAGVNGANDVTGGDGGYAHIDPLIEANQYGAYVYNTYYKTTNSWLIKSTATYAPSGVDYGQFINPTVFDSTDKMLYGDATLTTDNTGNAFVRWPVSGTTITRLTCATFGATAIQAQVASLFVSPNVLHRVYFGIDNGSIVYIDGVNTGTGAKTGTVVKPETAGVVSGMCIEKGNENHIIATSSNYGVVHVSETKDGGTTWTDISNNLPDIPVNWVIFDPRTPTGAIIATELGVWSTNNLNGTSTEWSPTNQNLANTRISMVKARYSDNTLYAATYGRGLFTSTLTNPANPLISFKQQRISVTEKSNATTNCSLGTSTITVPLMISEIPAGDVTVTVSSITGTTATASADYSFVSTAATFKNSDYSNKSISITIKDDKLTEGDETIALGLTITAGNANANLASTLTDCYVDIVDDEASPNLTSTPSNITGLWGSNLGPSSFLEGKTSPQKKIQYLYTAAELKNAGVIAGLPITNLAYNVSTKASAVGAIYKGFTFKIAHTNTVSLTTGTNKFATPSGSWTTVISQDYSCVAGANTFTLGTPFTWDGVSNVLMEFCYSNSTALTGDDTVDGQAGSINGMSRQTLGTTGATGCTLANPSAANIYKPIWTVVQQTIPQTVIASAANSTNSITQNAVGAVDFYDAANEIMGRIDNTGGFDYGCSSFTIDRAGTGASTFDMSNRTPTQVMNKTFRVIPTTNNASGSYTATFYFTSAEVTGWQTATGSSFANIKVIKTPNAISSYSAGSPAPANSDVITPTFAGTWGNGYKLTASFTTGFSGFAFGIPSAPLPVTLISFTGALQNGNSLLQWTTTSELNTKAFEVERSVDGVTFTKIGTVNAAGNSASERRYTFVDKANRSVNYYRLKIVDIDQNSKLSNTVLIKNDNMNQKIYVVNPFNNYIELQFAKIPTGSVSLSLYDLNGKLLSSGVYNNVNYSLRFNNVNMVFSKGVYVLQAEVDGVKYSYKIVKQ